MDNTYACLSGDRKFQMLNNQISVHGTPLVQVKCVGVCGTDMEWWKEGSKHIGQVLGHEYTGVIVDPGNSELRVGDRVSGYTQNIQNEYCGHCSACLDGNFANCNNRTVYTWKGGDKSHPGAFSRYTTWFSKSFYKLPNSISDEEGTLLEPLAVSLHGVFMTDIRPNDKVLILGGGIIGCGAAEWARNYGAGQIIITELMEEKIEIIKSFHCADHVIKADASDLYEQYAELSNGGFDIVFDCCGVGSAVNGAIEHAYKQQTRARKCFTSIAMSRGDLPIKYNDVILKEINWKGSKGHTPDEFETVLCLASAGKLNLKKYITKHISFEKIQMGFEDLDAQGGTPGKAIVVMQ